MVSLTLCLSLSLCVSLSLPLLPSGSTPLEGALCLLHVRLALQLLLEPASRATSGMVGELAAMQENVTTSGQATGDPCDWCEVLTNMLLNLLCQSSLSHEVAS